MSPAAARSAPASSTPEPSSYQRLREHLAYLQMSTAAEHLAAELDRGIKEKLSATQVLEQLLAIEVAATRERRQRGRLRFARYPVHKTLAEFDLDFQPGIDRKVVAELSTLRFVEEKRNVILLGPPGVGKSHLAIVWAFRENVRSKSSVILSSHGGFGHLEPSRAAAPSGPQRPRGRDRDLNGGG